jgi:preprotein translocase subunit YajC
MKVGNKVIDQNGYTGIITNIWNTGQIQVQQKPNVWCTYDSERQLTVCG